MTLLRRRPRREARVARPRGTALTAGTSAPSLRDVAEALRRLGAATLSQLAAEVGGTATGVEHLLAFWQRRGNVRTCADPTQAGCGTTCRACPLGRTPRSAARAHRGGAPTVYEWME